MPRNPRRSPRRSFRFRPSAAVLESRLVLSATVGAGTHAADVLSYHNNDGRTGSDTTETTLTPSTVTPTTFGKLFSDSVDGQVYAQPLYVQSLKMADGKVHSVLFVATENDQVYALDATSPTAGPAHNGVLWHVSLDNPSKGIIPVTSAEVDVDDITPNIGITGTPVIDPSTGALYVVAKMQVTSKTKATQYVQKLFALNLSTGATKAATTLGTTTINSAGQFVNKTNIVGSGIGTGSINGTDQFNALRSDQRAGLALDTSIPGNKDGMIVIAYSSHGDINPYHGWVLGYDPKTMKLESTYDTIPDGEYGAIWQGGAAPSIMANGDITAVVGNGTFDAYTTTHAATPTAIGDSGPGLGYEGLDHSVAVSFSAADPSTGTSGTGLYYNGITPGSSPIAPNVSENLQGTGIDFNSAAMDPNGSHTFAATITYDGSTLNEAIKDLTTGALYTHSYANVDIPATVGGSTAYVGFGGSTDGLMSLENIQNWTFTTPASTTPAVDQSAGFADSSNLSLNGMNASVSGSALDLTDGGGEEVGNVFATTPVSITNFATTFTFQFAMQSSSSSGSSSSSSPVYPIGDGITFIVQNATGHGVGPDYGESVLDLKPTGKTMTVVDSFTPTNYESLIQNDKDLGSTAALLLPSFPGTAHPNLELVAGKSGTIYLLDQDALGGYNTTADNVIQEITPSGNGFFASPSYSNGKVYYQAEGDVLRSFSLVLNPATDTMNLVQDPATGLTAGYPGTSPATSSNGTADGIVWTIDSSAYETEGPAILTAYDASNLANVLFTSSALPTNQAGPGIKFVTPTIANGRVYTGLNGQVDVYGLLSE